MKLADYLKLTTPPKSGLEFARECGILESTVRRILGGNDIYLSTALLIEKYTNGIVRCVDLAPTQQPKKRKPKSSKAAAHQDYS